MILRAHLRILRAHSGVLRARLGVLPGSLALLCAWILAGPGRPAAHAAPVPAVAEALDLDPDPAVLRVALVVAPLPADDARRAEGYAYAYNGQIPGPTLRAPLGATLEVEVHNQLDAPTTVHWHGSGAPFAMDGAPLDHGHGAPPGLDLPDAPAAIAPGARFTYRFPLTRAGTFWYHPHFDAHRQVDAGLFGALVVTDPAEPPSVLPGAPPGASPGAADAVEDHLWILDAPAEWHPARHTDAPGHEDPPGHRPGHLDPDAPPPTEAGLAARQAAAGLGQRPHEAVWRLNGAPVPLEITRSARPLRLRILNVSNTRYLALSARGLQQIAGDQGRWSAPTASGPFVLGPGDRGEFALAPTSGAESAEPITLSTDDFSPNGGFGHGHPQPLVTVLPAPPGVAPGGAPALPFDGAAPSADPPYTDLLYVLTGSDRTGAGLINGRRYPAVTPRRLPLGAASIIEVRNLSSSHHPFHIHGNRFEVLSVDGRPPTSRQLEDTVDIPIRARVRLRLQADNPGLWPVHCHLLPHAEDGMMTLLRIE